MENEIRSKLVKKLKKQTKELQQGADREKLGADREKLGADREKNAEEQIYIRTKAMESTLDGIFIIDAKKSNHRIIYVNSSYLRIIGYAKHEIIGHDYFLHYGMDADQGVINDIKQTLKNGSSFHGEMLNFRRDGTTYWSSLRIAPVRDISGGTTHFIGIKTDITSMKEKELQIVEQREELLHVTRVGKLAEFVSSLAHEINQPLTAILAYAQAAQRIYKGREPKLQEILQYIISDDQRATEVIRRLRSLLKKTKPSFEPLDINVLIKDTVVLISPDIHARNKVLTFKLGTELPFVLGDRIQLQQVILNLISNSLEAMDGEGSARDLAVKTSRKDAELVLVEVVDSGSGISAESMKNLFVHFYTTKSNGLGMGLPISRSIIETHGGRLDAKNNPDQGSTFYFTLPAIIK